MHILTKNDFISDAQKAIFQQGASLLLIEDDLQVGIWIENTPVYESEAIVTMGDCNLEGDNAVLFLKNCLNYLKKEFPNRPIVGPMNGSTWMKHRLILDSDGTEPFLMEPVEPESMKKVFVNAGFKVLSRYTSSQIDLTNAQPDFDKVERIITTQGITIRAIGEESFEEDLAEIYQLSIEAFSENFLYTPLPEKSFLDSYKSVKRKIDLDLVLLAYVDQVLVGFLFCIPDLDPKTVIVKTLATKPTQRTAGLGTYLVAVAQKRAKEKGYTRAIHALQFESNSSLRISQRFEAKVFRTYGLMIAK